MYPPVWGPTIWGTIHLMAYTYPDEPSAERKLSMSNFLQNLCINLPCLGCGIHCREYVTNNPPVVDSKTTLKKWAYDFHNAVNVRINKRILTHEEAEEAISKKYFQYEQWKDTNRAQEIREEDHRVIDMWKTKALNPDMTWLIVVSSIAGVACIVIVCMVVQKYRKKNICNACNNLVI